MPCACEAFLPSLLSCTQWCLPSRMRYQKRQARMRLGHPGWTVGCFQTPSSRNIRAYPSAYSEPVRMPQSFAASSPGSPRSRSLRRASSCVRSPCSGNVHLSWCWTTRGLGLEAGPTPSTCSSRQPATIEHIRSCLVASTHNVRHALSAVTSRVPTGIRGAHDRTVSGLCTYMACMADLNV